VINGLQHVFEKWVERCKKCIACQGRYFEKETVTAPPLSSDSEVIGWIHELFKRPSYFCASGFWKKRVISCNLLTSLKTAKRVFLLIKLSIPVVCWASLELGAWPRLSIYLGDGCCLTWPLCFKPISPVTILWGWILRNVVWISQYVRGHISANNLGFIPGEGNPGILTRPAPRRARFDSIWHPSPPLRPL